MRGCHYHDQDEEQESKRRKMFRPTFRIFSIAKKSTDCSIVSIVNLVNRASLNYSITEIASRCQHCELGCFAAISEANV